SSFQQNLDREIQGKVVVGLSDHYGEVITFHETSDFFQIIRAGHESDDQLRRAGVLSQHLYEIRRTWTINHLADESELIVGILNGETKRISAAGGRVAMKSTLVHHSDKRLRFADEGMCS